MKIYPTLLMLAAGCSMAYADAITEQQALANACMFIEQSGPQTSMRRVAGQKACAYQGFGRAAASMLSISTAMPAISSHPAATARKRFWAIPTTDRSIPTICPSH